jgi:hypothetical protein
MVSLGSMLAGMAISGRTPLRSEGKPMTKIPYWADSYIEKRRDAETVIRMIRPGQRVFIGSACGEPQMLVRAMAANSQRFIGLEIVRMMSQESTSLTEIANKTHELNLSIRHIYLGSASTHHFRP